MTSNKKRIMLYRYNATNLDQYTLLGDRRYEFWLKLARARGEI